MAEDPGSSVISGSPPPARGGLSLADIAELVAQAAVLLYVQPAQRRRLAESRKKRHEAAKQSA
ncbi:hypothetical protein ACFY3M_55085 [Streptomyces mirabilis]|uniref:hypothetical protein n=1 Tax=Streptomyces mirabilis TaxID=68239 RepID=UPI0036C2664B